MTDELERRNPCGENKEIDEYLGGTICEIREDEEDINDIASPGDEKFDVDDPDEPETIEDDYVGKL